MEFHDKLHRLRKQKGLSSLDELVLDKIPERAGETSRAAEIISMIVCFGLYGFPK